MSTFETVFADWPDAARQAGQAVRAMIHDEANAAEAGPLSEALKWGQPSFLTEATKSGTTIRLAWSKKAPDALQMLVHCQTSLVDTWRARFPELAFQGNRALMLPLDSPLPDDALRVCIRSALTYHKAKS